MGLFKSFCATVAPAQLRLAVHRVCILFQIKNLYILIRPPHFPCTSIYDVAVCATLEQGVSPYSGNTSQLTAISLRAVTSCAITTSTRTSSWSTIVNCKERNRKSPLKSTLLKWQSQNITSLTPSLIWTQQRDQTYTQATNTTTNSSTPPSP